MDVCVCSALDSEVCENIDIYNKQVHAKIINKDIWFIYSIFKAISIKISEHHEANPGFNSGSPVESPSCKHVFVRERQYLRLDGVATNYVVGVWLGTQEFKSI